jgi:glycerol-3-phosphate dehydrogenase subunit B
MRKTDPLEYPLAVVGTGLAGMAAALFAANRGIPTAQVGGAGGILFASGFLDLLGIHPVEQARRLDDPWAGIQELRRDIPEHPLARMRTEDIRLALAEYLAFLEEAHLPYVRFLEKNVDVLTPMGTVKPTYGVPWSMQAGVEALQDKRPCLLVDFLGLKEFNARLITSAMEERWPGLRWARISFPGAERMSRVFTRHMAKALELQAPLDDLAEKVRPLVRDAGAVGMPAIFGISRSHEIVSRFQQAIGVPVFEIPTLPASVPGFRLRMTFSSFLPARGIRSFFQSRVLDVREETEGGFVLSVGNTGVEHTLRVRGVILATGRFFSQGLIADRKSIREPLFDLPVRQPEARKLWHRRDLMDPAGHAVNRAGLDVDNRFRPLGRDGKPAFQTLFASGSILAHQDWMRMKCGSGLAIATAFAAVKAFCEICGEK